MMLCSLILFCFGSDDGKEKTADALNNGISAANGFAAEHGMAEFITTDEYENSGRSELRSVSSGEKCNIFFTVSASYPRASSKRFELRIESAEDDFNPERDIDLDLLCEFANVFALKKFDSDKVYDAMFSDDESYLGSNFGLSETTKMFFVDFFETEQFTYDTLNGVIQFYGRAKF